LTTPEGSMIKFVCECGKKYKAKDSLAGRDSHCKVCGVPIRVPRKVEPWNCPSCGGELETDGPKCIHCGEWMKETPQPSTSPPPPAEDLFAEPLPSTASSPPPEEIFDLEPSPSPVPPPPPADAYTSHPQAMAAQPSPPGRYSLAQPTWHVVILTVLTVGIYQLYWFPMLIR
jgi:hypothetical protein